MGTRKHPWHRSRGYLHFDLPIGIKKAESIVSSPAKVARHAFWPLIDYEILSVKIRKNDDGKLTRKQKSRPIAYASHLDSHIYAYYSRLLERPYEERLLTAGISDCVLAFRQLGKSNIEFARDAFMDISASAPIGVVAIDISGFFDNLNHQLLKHQWASLLGESRLPPDHYAVFKSLTQYSRVNRDLLYRALNVSKQNPKKNRKRLCTPSDFDRIVRGGKMISTNTGGRGIPQGSPISALLSNIYMFQFDREMQEIVGELGGRYYRYCDDMLFIVPQEYMAGVEDTVTERIGKLKLTINPDKTEKRIFRRGKNGGVIADKPLQYLGFLFDGQRILIRSAAFARYSQRMKKGVRLAKKTRIKRNNQRIQNGLSPKVLYRRQIYERYSHLGKRNFVRYGLRAADIMNSNSIRRQLKPLWRELKSEIDKV